MLEERPKIEQAVQAVCSREGMTVTRLPQDHAGGKWRLRYESSMSGGGNLEVDLNYMFRVPLWPVTRRDSRPVGSFSAKGILVLDVHELAAGKLVALLSRGASRDLFDVRQLLSTQILNRRELRLGFVLYGAMNRMDWRTVSFDAIDTDARELENQLVPLMRSSLAEEHGASSNCAEKLVEECRQKLDVVLPLADNEREFLDRLLDHGEIDPALLTQDEQMSVRIRSHPLLQWKALNVRQHKLDRIDS